MNRTMIKRLINQYLDGEIGLADKAELERVMAEEPHWRREYQELRRIGLHLGSMAEVSVHPQKFRDRIMTSIEQRERSFITPQRAFAGAMLVALLVLALTFTLLMYQQQVFNPGNSVAPNVEELIPAADRNNTMFIDAQVEAEKFFDRLISETHNRFIDPELLNCFITQTNVYEGAVCATGLGLNVAVFPRGVPDTVKVRMTPRQSRELAEFAAELDGGSGDYWARGLDGTKLDYDDYVQLNPDVKLVNVVIVLK